MATLVAPIKLRCDTAANWTAANPTLLLGEVGVEINGVGSGARTKIGDGVTAWVDLDYASSGGEFDGTILAENVEGLGSAALLDTGTAEGQSPVLGVGGVLAPAVIPALVGTAVRDALAALVGTDRLALAAVKADADHHVPMIADSPAVTVGQTVGLKKTATGKYEPSTSVGSPTIADVTGLTSALAGKIDTTPAGLASVLLSTSADVTYGPQFGEAIGAARLSQSAATLFSQWNAELIKQKLVAFVLPYEGDEFPAFDTGDILTAGVAVGSNIFGISTVPTVTLEQSALSFPITNNVGEVEYNSYSEAWTKLQLGSPYVTRQVNFASNILSFDARLGRKIITDSPVANCTAAASCWDYILDNELPVEVYVPVGATAYTFSPTAGDDGMLNFPPPGAFTAGAMQKYLFSRVNGIPYMQWCCESDALVTPKPSFVGVTANANLNSANPWALALHGSALPGDSVLLFASNPASSSLPILPTINGVALTDSATGGDANSPAVRTCWKTNLTAEEITAGLAGTSGTGEVYALVFRKAGSAPTFVLPTYYKTPSTATTAVSWPAVAFAQDCILAGFFQCQGTDDLPMRTGLTEIADRPPSSASAVGISGLLRYGVDSAGATTTTKTGTAGRAVTSQVAVY